MQISINIDETGKHAKSIHGITRPNQLDFLMTYDTVTVVK